MSMAIRRNGRRQQTPREMNGKLAPTNFWSAGSLIGLRGQQRAKKCRFAISAESAFRNLSIRTRTNDVCDIGIQFRSPGNSLQSIFPHVPHGTFSAGPPAPSRVAAASRRCLHAAVFTALSSRRKRKSRVLRLRKYLAVVAGLQTRISLPSSTGAPEARHTLAQPVRAGLRSKKSRAP